MRRLYPIIVVAALAAQTGCQTGSVIGVVTMQALNGDWSQWDKDRDGACAAGYERIQVEPNGRLLRRYWFDRASGKWSAVPQTLGVLGVETADTGTERVQLYVIEPEDRGEQAYRSRRATITLLDANKLEIDFWSADQLSVRTPYGTVKVSAHGDGATYRRCRQGNGQG